LKTPKTAKKARGVDGHLGAEQAAKAGESINQFISERLEEVA
jgi:predicted HicB family RNase H-like nuclease